MIAYHIAGPTWKLGDPLICRDRLIEAGVDIPWKWEDAPEGFDGDVVCIFTDLAEACEFEEQYGGTIVELAIPDHINDDPEMFRTPYGYIEPRLTENEEGYTCIQQGIPAQWILRIVECEGRA